MSEYRSEDRKMIVPFRCSQKNKDRLPLLAARDGFATVQGWLHAKLLGKYAPKRDQEALPLTSP